MDEPSIVRWHDGRDVYVYPDGSALYVDEIRDRLLADAEERRSQPLVVDDIEALMAKLRASCYEYVPPVISPNIAKLLGIPLDDPDVMPEIDTTEEEFDRAMAEGESVELEEP